MTSNRISSRTRDSTIDRLALSRAQHLQSRENRPKSVSDDEIDAVSDWSDSDRECCPLSDFESSADLYDNNDYRQEKTTLLPEIFHPNASCSSETPLPTIDDSNTSTRISFSSENEKTKISSINLIKSRKQSQAPLLPARRMTTKEVAPSRPVTNPQLPYNSRYRKAIATSPTRIYLRRETTSTSTSSNTHLSKDSTNTSFQSHDEQQILSPNFSQASVPRVYELKKIFLDDSDYGRLTDYSSTRTVRPPSRQKWGTIVHPPFPLGYQHIAPEQVTQAVERLSSPVRCRERHTPIQTPSKRYLSVEETEALINRLTKVKTIRSPDQYWPIQGQSRSVKTLNNNNWKTVGISA